jgi:hypothetical protein
VQPGNAHFLSTGEVFNIFVIVIPFGQITKTKAVKEGLLSLSLRPKDL